MLEGNIDSLLDQISDNTVNVVNCCECGVYSQFLIKLECKHLICADCAGTFVSENNFKKCPSCGITLSKNIEKHYRDYISNPLINLITNHSINIGEFVWAYSGGSGHYWLYCADHIKQLEEADSNGDSLVELEIALPSGTEIYVVDLDQMKQYPKNSPSKKRFVTKFLLQSKKDLSKNKIIGINGKFL